MQTQLMIFFTRNKNKSSCTTGESIKAPVNVFHYMTDKAFHQGIQPPSNFFSFLNSFGHTDLTTYTPMLALLK